MSVSTSKKSATSKAATNPHPTLRVYNTLSRDQGTFEPVQPGKVGIYLCGPTVYKPATSATWSGR